MPLCFEVRINAGPATIVGQPDMSVLTACLTFVPAHNELEFRAGGLVSKGPHDNEHIEWMQQDFKVGDRVSIRVVEADVPSEPISRERRNPADSEREERAYYAHLKKKYEPDNSAA
jgi:hypothetical protein